jgi:hypothetical protein
VVDSRRCGKALCHDVQVTCGGIPVRKARIREREVAEPRGAVIFATGVYGVEEYDDEPERKKTLETMIAAGYETFEIQWGGGRQGWGAGAEGAGFEAAMCGYAAIVRWIAAERAGRPQVVCAQGNSGAAQQIAYGLTTYGLGDVLDLAVLSGGPPITDIVELCFAPTRLPRDKLWRQNGRRIADEMMGWEGKGDYCKKAEGTADAVAAARRDSLVPPQEGRVYDFPATRVFFVESERDKSAPQGKLFHDAITSHKVWETVPGNEHGVDRTLPGAARIREILLGECREP